MHVIHIIGIFAIFIILYCSALRMSTSSYYEYYNDLKQKVKDKKLAQLMNGQLMDNLPNINLFVNNHHWNDMIKCTSTNAAFLRDVPDDLTEDDIDANNHSYDSQCQKICNSGSAKAIVITDPEKQEIYMNNTRLNSGIWCVGKRPQCNLRTTYAVVAANGNIVCRSKFPNLFGGPTGDKVIACNNLQYFNYKNKLMDNLTNEEVDPKTIVLSSEDETIVNEQGKEVYRFTCHFDVDDHENQYIEHPLNRFHPFKHPCTIKLTKQTEIKPGVFNPETVECDCSTWDSEYIKNALVNDKRSTCTQCINKYQAHQGNLRIESECFSNLDPATDARHKLPCIGDKVNDDSVRCDVIELAMKPMERLVDSLDKPMMEFRGAIRIDADYE